jgi:hypothetical protein
MSPFLLLWYNGMPSPLYFLISFGLVIPCKFAIKLSSPVTDDCRLGEWVARTYLGANFHQMVVEMLDVLLKTN